MGSVGGDKNRVVPLFPEMGKQGSSNQRIEADQILCDMLQKVRTGQIVAYTVTYLEKDSDQYITGFTDSCRADPDLAVDGLRNLQRRINLSNRRRFDRDNKKQVLTIKNRIE